MCNDLLTSSRFSSHFSRVYGSVSHILFVTLGQGNIPSRWGLRNTPFSCVYQYVQIQAQIYSLFSDCVCWMIGKLRALGSLLQMLFQLTPSSCVSSSRHHVFRLYISVYSQVFSVPGMISHFILLALSHFCAQMPHSYLGGSEKWDSEWSNAQEKKIDFYLRLLK